MKIDLSKAYDTVDWEFVDDLLKLLCFPSRFIKWIMTCLKGTNYHLLLNGRIQDDLVIFCKGDLNSVRLTHDAFMKFCNDTVSEEVKSKIMDIVKIEEGGFPLEYLGVNLRPTKWKVKDCGVILDKLNKNLNCWASRNLSFAGRAQLIHSVMLGIINFWMSIFTIPSKITAAIDKSCRDFLWGSSGNSSKLHQAS
ncbi:uncharacterized protein LOC133030535 [Cannabis sativa]|uniref:uncharacterized protein LOC133030535 n=1 Tax=Cannabis sativa TaxID=3483 RepID=UPI0029CA0927|nr:uncharacterized protein LOC133030535 [Cannabis sativa]